MLGVSGVRARLPSVVNGTRAFCAWSPGYNRAHRGQEHICSAFKNRLAPVYLD